MKAFVGEHSTFIYGIRNHSGKATIAGNVFAVEAAEAVRGSETKRKREHEKGPDDDAQGVGAGAGVLIQRQKVRQEAQRSAAIAAPAVANGVPGGYTQTHMPIAMCAK